MILGAFLMESKNQTAMSGLGVGLRKSLALC